MRILVLLFLAQWGFTQSSNGLLPHSLHDWRIGIVPTTVIDITPTFTVTFSKGVSSFIELGGDFAYGQATTDNELSRIGAFRPFVRVYPIPSTGMYFGIQADLRYREKDKARFLQRLGGAYQQYFEFKERSRYTGLLFSVGQVMNYGRFCFDGGVSFGVSSRYTWHRGLPSDIVRVGNRIAAGASNQIFLFYPRFSVMYSLGR